MPILIGPLAAAAGLAEAEAAGLLAADAAGLAEAEAAGLLGAALEAAGGAELAAGDALGAAPPPQADSVSARTTPGSRLDVRNMMLSAPTGSSGY